MRETWVQSLGREDPLEKELATHSSILAWRLPWTEEPGGLQVHGVTVGHHWATKYSGGHRELDTTEATEHTRVQYIENYPNLLTLSGFNILLLLCQIHILICSV